MGALSIGASVHTLLTNRAIFNFVQKFQSFDECTFSAEAKWNKMSIYFIIITTTYLFRFVLSLLGLFRGSSVNLGPIYISRPRRRKNKKNRDFYTSKVNIDL
jgi:hypothetical protein